MARTVTLLELRDAVRRRGGWINSRRVTTTFLNDVINSAITEVWDLIVEKWADYYTTETNLVTVVGSDAVALPANFYKLCKLELQISATQFERLRPFALAASHRFSAGVFTGVRNTFRYRLQGGNIRLSSPATTVQTLRLFFIPVSPKLVADGDTFDGINGYEELVIQLAKAAVQDETGLDSSVSRQRVTEMIGRIRTAADGRDSEEPFYLDALGPSLDDDDAEDWP
jgi:hypothetical protein